MFIPFWMVVIDELFPVKTKVWWQEIIPLTIPILNKVILIVDYNNGGEKPKQPVKLLYEDRNKSRDRDQKQ